VFEIHKKRNSHGSLKRKKNSTRRSSGIILVQLTVPQTHTNTKILVLYGTQQSITLLTTARQLSLSSAT